MVSLMAGIPLWPFEVFEIVCTALLALVMLFDAVEIFAAVGSKDKRRKIIDGLTAGSFKATVAASSICCARRRS